jgi:hypothetical protein
MVWRGYAEEEAHALGENHLDESAILGVDDHYGSRTVLHGGRTERSAFMWLFTARIWLVFSSRLRL